MLKSISGYRPSASSCRSWEQVNGLTHAVLRDDGSVAQDLGLSTYTALLLDRNLKIVARENLYYSSGKQKISTALQGLQ